MLICPKCGYYNSDVATRCDQCGGRLSDRDSERRRDRQSVAPAAAVAQAHVAGVVTVPQPVEAAAAELVTCPGCGAQATSRFCANCGRQLLSEPQYAGFWIRSGAAIIDSIVVSVVLLFRPHVLSLGLTLLVVFLVPAVYEIGFEAKTGATLGKRAVGVRVVRPDLQPAGIGRSIARHVAHYLSSVFLVGYIMVAFNRQKRALHDYIAGTIVIKER
jgi:uncharacterized RDD family membrane protein YckC